MRPRKRRSRRDPNGGYGLMSHLEPSLHVEELEDADPDEHHGLEQRAHHHVVVVVLVG